MRNVWVPDRAQSHILIACGSGLLLGIAALRFSPTWTLFGLVGVLFLVVIAHKPEFGLLAIVLVTSLVDSERLPLLTMGPMSLHITDVILLFLLALVLLRALVAPDFILVRTPLDIPLLWFYFAIVLSAILAIIQPSFGADWVLRWLRPLTYYLAFFCVTNLIRDRRQLAVLVHGLFLIAVVAAFAMLIQVLYPSIHLVKARSTGLVTAGQEWAGVERTYGQADRLTYLMLLVSVCSLALGSRWLSPTLEFARTGILSIGLFLTFQRNYWLTMISMVGLLGSQVSWSQRSRILRWALIGAIAVALLSIFAGASADRYLAAATDRLARGMQPETLAQDSSTQWRVTETHYALGSIAEHPLLGVGLANFYRPALQYDLYHAPYGMRYYIHNAYLWVWVDMGLVGLIPFVWLLAQVLVRGFGRWRKVGDPRWRAVALGVTLGILGQAITNIVAPNFIQSWGLVVFPILLGVNELIFRWELTDIPERGIPC